MAQLLTEVDAAKEALRQMGFGCAGTPWPEIVKEIHQGFRLNRVDQGGW